MKAPELTYRQRIARAILTPGRVLGRLPGEGRIDWQTRAVMEVVDRHYRSRPLGRYWPTERAIAFLDGGR